MALDLATTNKAHKVKIENSQFKKKIDSVDPWEKPKKKTKRESSVNETSMKRERSVNETSMKRERNVNETSVVITKRESNVNETSMKRERNVNETSMNFDHNLLTTFQIKIGLYLVNNYTIDPSRCTGRVNTLEMTKKLQSTNGSLRSSILQMKKKGCFEKLKSKKFHREFTLTESFFYHMEALRKTSNVNETSMKRESTVNQPLAHTSMNLSSSSSSKINTTTTTEESLEKIQTPLNLKNLGFGIGHIKQLKEKFNLPLDQIQKNLESFAYDLDHGELKRLKSRGVQNIIGYFFGAMKNGGYNSVKEGFVTAEEFAEQEMLKRLEKKKTEREERKKKLEELLFEEWLETKTRNELIEIEKPALDVMDSFHKAALREYFINNEIIEFQKGFQ